MNRYDSTSIQIYKGLDAVRKRPGMYIGNTDDGSGLHRMVFEVIDNSIDESLAGYCDLINVALYSDGYISIFDNGRGMPTDIYKDEKKSAAEIIMTVLHSGAKFNEKSYRLSGGLHGVGISVVNALSKFLRLRIFRSGFIYEQLYYFGKPTGVLKFVGHTDKRGTEIKFLPDSSIFRVCKFDYNVLLLRFKELSFLNSRIVINLVDKRIFPCSSISCHSSGGIIEFVQDINRKTSVINKDVLFFSGKKNGVSINIAMQWVNTFNEKISCYTNNIYQKDGGSHLVGLKSALTKVFKSYIDDQMLKSKNKILVQGDDVREGFVSILSVYMTNPKFSSQVKDKLISLEARQSVEFILSSYLKDYLYENPIISKLILNKILSSARARNAARRARDLNRKRTEFDCINFFSKLSDCQEKNPIFSELFLVEGDSAGGSAKQARDRKIQAILPLKGKILNVERSGFDKMLSNSELKSIVSVLKCGIGLDDFDKKNLRYHKIIFMTDADVDGSHIRTLLMTFFYRHLPWLIEDGHIFISRPPLYRFQKGRKTFYIKDKSAFNKFLFDRLFEEFSKLDDFDLDLLKSILSLYERVVFILDNLSINYPRVFFEKLIYFKVFLSFDYIKSKLDFLSYNNFLNSLLDGSQRFDIKDDMCVDGLLKIIFMKYGVLREYNLDLKFFASDDYKVLKECHCKLFLLFGNRNNILFKGKTYGVYDFGKLLDDLKDQIMSKYIIQRYKGLGEMNPDQLWCTTMNPKTRNLQQIKIKDVVSANSMFSSLMGENIDERKKFIEEHYRSFLELEI